MGSVSVALPFTDRWYFEEILAGARGRIESSGHSVVVRVVPPSPTSTADVADVLEHDLALPETVGAMVAGFKYRPEQSARALAWGRPLVAIGGVVAKFPTVMIDDAAGAQTATNHLIELRHERITHLAGIIEDQMDFSVHGRRAKGYRVAMEMAGLHADVRECAFDADEAYRVATELLSGPDRPTAVFAVSDEMAFSVLHAGRDLGIPIGSELSVVGFDDHPLAEAEGLTTIRQNPRELGAGAADLLINGLETGLEAAHSRLLPTTLVTRTSTRARPAR